MKIYADSTLQAMTKKELIKIIRVLEYNLKLAWECNKNQADAVEKLLWLRNQNHYIRGEKE